MRFGIFLVVDHYPAERPRTSAQFYGELLEQVEAAEALGFESFWIAGGPTSFSSRRT
jgi:alkanesulfonate monooxygenase SsuD/methylene tetrahydromethanopterin reductase-like flavin-dependent oxidoreductase (luciferase family)